MANFKKHKTHFPKWILLPLIVLGILALPQIIAAQEGITEHMTVFPDAGLPETDLITIIGNVIQWIFGFLGLIAVIIIIIAGFQWMASKGNPEKIDKAKKIMKAGIIGLIIILSSYIIVSFIIRALEEDIFPPGNGNGNGNGNGPEPPSARFLVVTDKSPKSGQEVARNTKVIVSFSQNLVEESVRLAREEDECPNPTVYIINQDNDEYVDGAIVVRGNSFVFTPGGDCPPPLDAFQCQETETSEGCYPTFSDDACCGCFEPGEYEVILESGDNGILGQRSYGNTLGADVSWNFEVGDFVGDEAPEVEIALPLDGSEVAMNAGIAVTFTKPIDLTTLSAYNPDCVIGSPNCSYENCGQDECQSWATDNIDEATVKITINGEPVAVYFEKFKTTSFMIRPIGSCPEPYEHCHCFLADSQIDVKLEEEIKGANCLSLNCDNGKCDWFFTTNDEIDLEGPVVESTNPADGTKGVDRLVNEDDISVLFDEPLDPTSINEDTFKLSSMLPSQIYTSSPDAEKAIYIPYRLLDAKTNYRATIYGGGQEGGTCDLNPDFAFGVRDIYGNSMEKAYHRWAFETSSTINQGDPYIDWLSPSQGPIGQCLTIHGYNLGCCPNGQCPESDPKQAQYYTWDFIDGQCKPAQKPGRIQFLTEAGEFVAWVDLADEDILLWEEINRDCPPEGCPNNYSPENQIIIHIPQGASGKEGNIRVFPPGQYGGGTSGDEIPSD